MKLLKERQLLIRFSLKYSLIEFVKTAHEVKQIF